jgi:hypothetical protein
MFRRLKSLFHRKTNESEPQPARRSFQSGAECEVPERARQLAHRLLRTVLNALDAEDKAGQIHETPIAPYRSLVEMLPIRVYVYTLGSFIGDMEFESMLESQRPTGAVFDAFEITIDGIRCGFYVYSLQPVSDSDFLTNLWQRLRREIGGAVRSVALPTAHTRHHREATKRSESDADIVSIEGDPDAVAENLIRPHLPEKFLDDVSLDSDEGIAELLWLLIRRMGHASIEKDELIRFVQRNERPLRAKVLKMLPEMAEAAKASDEKFGEYFDYFHENVQLALAGKTDKINMRSDRLFWLLFALTQQLDSNLITYAKARDLIARPQTTERISEHQLVYMFYDFADALETPQQASTTLMMLLTECAIIAKLARPLRFAAEFVGKYPVKRPRDALLLLDRAGACLQSLGEDASEVRAAKARLVKRGV